MTSLHAKDVHPELFKAGAHPGIWMDRFCPQVAICDQKGRKEHLDTICGMKPAAGEYATLRQRHLVACKAAGQSVQCLPLTLRWRMAIHLSRASALENAATCLHPIYGFAYLPGSGLKGLARAYASLLWDRCGGAGGKSIEGVSAADFTARFLVIFGWAPNDERRGETVKTASGAESLRDPAFGGHDPQAAAQRGGIVFHDAWADHHPTLEVDVTTCHYPEYYRDQKAPGDWQEPIPVTFLAIAPETRFTFIVTGADQALVDQAIQWLFGGLYWLGAGAKTAAGYGGFEWDEAKQREADQRVAEETAAQKKRAEAELQAAAAKRVQAEAAQGLIAIAMGLSKDEVLAVPVPSDQTQPGSRTGYTLTYQDARWTRGPDFHFKKEPLAKGLVFKLVSKGSKNDKGQIELQCPCVATNALSPI